MSTVKRVAEPPSEQVEELSLRVPVRAMQAIRQMAAYLDMPCDVLVRRYISRGLRVDRAAYFGEQAFPLVEESLREAFGDDPRVDIALAAARARLSEDAAPRTRPVADDQRD